MRSYVLHDATGTIVQTGTCDDASWELVQKNIPAGLSLATSVTVPPSEVAFNTPNDASLTSYVTANGEIRPRQTMQCVLDKPTIAADGEDVATITDLPMPCAVSIAGAIETSRLDVADGTLELTCDHPGEINVSVDAAPAWLPWSVTIHAA
jgi:hypothetical protein